MNSIVASGYMMTRALVNGSVHMVSIGAISTHTSHYQLSIRMILQNSFIDKKVGKSRNLTNKKRRDGKVRDLWQASNVFI